MSKKKPFFNRFGTGYISSRGIFIFRPGTNDKSKFCLTRLTLWFKIPKELP